MTAVAAAARLLHDFVEDRSFSLQLLSDIDLRRVARGPVNVGSLVALKPARDVNVAGSSDALRILSDNWSDGSAGKNARPNASAQTTIQAAIFSGHTPSTLGGQGGGQFENFPRFLENFFGVGGTVTINGSFVSLWFAQYTNSTWECCNYYQPSGSRLEVRRPIPRSGEPADSNAHRRTGDEDGLRSTILGATPRRFGKCLVRETRHRRKEGAAQTAAPFAFRARCGTRFDAPRLAGRLLTPRGGSQPGSARLRRKRRRRCR